MGAFVVIVVEVMEREGQLPVTTGDDIKLSVLAELSKTRVCPVVVEGFPKVAFFASSELIELAPLFPSDTW